MDTLSSTLTRRLQLGIESLLQAKAADSLPDSLVASIRDSARVLPANDTRFGDFQTNAAMLLAKPLKSNPRAIATELIPLIDVSGLCDPLEIAGAGFINFRVSAECIHRFLQEAGADERLGVPAPAQPKTVVVDFSSPNVAKPMHVGHLRSTILGDALARISAFAGHKVIRDNHIGDWGTQFGMLLVGWKSIMDPAALQQDALKEMERIYKQISARCKEDPATLDAARAELVKLQDGDKENLAIWQEMQRLSQGQFDAMYQRLAIRFDVTLGESFYNPHLKAVASELIERGIASESEGAICVFSDGKLPEKEDPFLIQRDGEWHPNPALVLKSDGASNYTTTDLATLRYRLETWNPDEILYLTDGRQQLHFRQLFAIFGRWHPEASVRLAHVWFGAILGEDGKPFKTRSGENIRLSDLLDEAEERAFKAVTEKNPDLPEADRREIARMVGIGAVKYADLSPNRQSDYVFSWDRMLALQGNTAPYLQYSHVRIRSIFRKLGEDFTWPASITLQEPAEIALAKKLFLFGDVLAQVLDDYRPNILCTYLYELASTFHSFFESCPVLKAEGATRDARLALCDFSGRILNKGLELLGIESPERM